jgi:hypothetical protein
VTECWGLGRWMVDEAGPIVPLRCVRNQRDRHGNPTSHALKGHDTPPLRPAITPLQGYSVDLAPVSQGDALGCRISPLRG